MNKLKTKASNDASPISARPSPEAQNTSNLKHIMKRNPLSQIASLLLGTVLLAWAGTAVARDIVVEFVTVTVTSLNTPTPLGPSDTILVRNGGTLFVDTDAVIGQLTIGDAATPGTVSFPGTHTFTVATNVVFGADSGNRLDMSAALTAPVLKVGGQFLQSGAGQFLAGSGTVEYTGITAQTVTARIGGVGATIQYKDLILSGNPATGNANKTFAPGVSVQGVLDIREKAKPAGSSATYGSLARLQYSGSIAQTTSTAEWPPFMPAQVTIANAAGVTLDGDKQLGPNGAFSSVLVVQSGVTLKDAGKILTVQGAILNDGGIEGAGRLVLGGSTAQTLSGNGNYGNVTLNNAAGASLPGLGNNPPQPVIRGRLTIQNGRLMLPTGTTHQASLLTYGGSDKVANIYGATGSGASVISNVAFNGLGTLTVPAKPAAVLANTGAAPTLTYGASGFTISGTVRPPVGTPNFATFGNGAVDGEVVTVTIGTTPSLQAAAIVQNGSFSATFTAAGLNVGQSFPVSFSYPGGINLASATLANATTLSVVPKAITVIPINTSKIYGAADPTFTFTISPPDGLVGSDTFTGALTRFGAPTTLQPVGLQNIGLYDIELGTLVVTNVNVANSTANNNYVLTFDPSKKLTILQKPVTVTINSASKTYGNADPAFTASFSPALIAGDVPSGALTRAAGANVGVYAITRGTFTAGPNYSETFNNGTLTISPRAAVVTFADASKIYGNANPTFTPIVTPALVSGDTFSGAAGRDSGETVAGSPYTIRQGSLSLGTKGVNYNLSFPASGKLTINKRLVAVTAASPSKTYGANLPALVTYETGAASASSGFVTASGQIVPAQSVPVTPPTITWGGQGTPNACSPIGPYNYTVNNNAGDPNYSFSPPAGNPGTLTVNKANLTIRPDNKTKVADGNLFNFNAYAASYNGFVCGDTASTLTGSLLYGGPATSAVDPGVYPINASGQTSADKYTVIYNNGYLTITTSPTTDQVTIATWTNGGSYAWLINNPNGTPGGNPGWKLLRVNGALDLTGATTGNNKFRLDLVTMSGNAAGRMPKFDPTRPYSWEFVRANSIQVSGTFNPDVFEINYDGLNLFSNQVFGGTFKVRKDGNSLILDFTPVGTARDAVSGVVSAGTVPGNYNVAPLLTDVLSSDLDVLYLQPNTASIGANDTMTINLNVANLQQPVVGVNAFINFSSAQYKANATGAGAPQVQAGGGVWDTLIFRTWNIGGDLDVVIAVNLGSQVGTSADGTVGKIILTPTKTQTGSSRVVFRVDDTNAVPPVLTYLEPAAGGAQILPVRVMTPAISIATDGSGPSLSAATMTASQAQPHGATVDVKGGTQANRREVVRTGGSGATTSGPVLFTIPASDAGVGLSGPPTLTLKQAGQMDIVVPCTTPNLLSGNFQYSWNVPVNIANGTWSANVSATDTISPTPNTTTVNNAFNLSVNTREVNGVVELQSFKGTNRIVNFAVGDNDSGSAASVRTWNHDLNFTSGLLLNAGAFQNRQGLADKIKNSTDPLSVYLAYGDIVNLAALRDSIVNKTDGVSIYLNGLFYGVINNLASLAARLTTPVTAVDDYIVSRLSSGTILLLADYQAANAAGKAALAPTLTTALLNDFNTIVLGPSIYDPVRFASVPLVHTPTPVPNPPAGPQRVELNRNLLWDAYPTQYRPGQLGALTAQRLTQYAGGTDTALANALVKDLDTLTVSPAMWPPATPPFGQSLYNEVVFLGVPLSAQTVAQLTTVPFPTGNALTLLNQRLLQDAYPGVYVRAPLSPATVQAARNYNAASFETGMIVDLNALISSGSSIYTDARFAPWIGGVDPSSELGQLLAKPNPTPAELVRMNRLLLELAYDAELSKGVLAAYRLVQVLGTTSEATAKTAWNLRAQEAVSFDSTLSATANFVSDGAANWLAGSDLYLRGGDITGDNLVNLADYNAMRLLFGQVGAGGASSDINGDGLVNIFDYSLMQLNWARTGDAAAK